MDKKDVIRQLQIFVGKSRFFFIYKKTERLVSAIYLVTNLIFRPTLFADWLFALEAMVPWIEQSVVVQLAWVWSQLIQMFLFFHECKTLENILLSLNEKIQSQMI